MSRIPDFMESLEKMAEVHIRKNEDYATATDPLSNFKYCEFCLEPFTNSRDKPFVAFIATKMARLASLLSADRVPNNESIDDNFIDIANYVLLWKARVKESKIDAIQELIEDALPPFPITVVDNVVFKCQIHDIIHCASCIQQGREFYPTSHRP